VEVKDALELPPDTETEDTMPILAGALQEE